MKKFLAGLIAFLFLFIGSNVWVVQAYEIDAYPNKNTSSFDAVLRTDYRDRIRQEYPAVVAVGDSAIRQLDEEVFSQAAGAKTVIFSAPGSGSAYWYLMIRNQIIASGALPRAVLIFFRGTTLTVPEYRVRGSYFVRLDEIGGSGDQDGARHTRCRSSRRRNDRPV